MTSVYNYFCCSLFSNRNNRLSRPATWICSLSFHNIQKVQVLPCSFPQNTTNVRHTCRGGMAVPLASPGRRSDGRYTHLAPVGKASTPGPASDGKRSFSCSLSIERPDEGNDSNRESRGGCVAHYLLNNLGVISGLSQTFKEPESWTTWLGPTPFP